MPIRGFCIILLMTFYFVALGQSQLKSSNTIVIQWVDSLKGDFSFTNEWSYPEGVVMKENGRAECGDGGLCPEECYNMLDSNGNIYKDSLHRYYDLLDTTHQYYSISCTAHAYEYAGTNFIKANRKSKDTVYAYTLNNIATHSSLELNITKNTCTAEIKLNSIRMHNHSNYSPNTVEDTVSFDDSHLHIQQANYETFKCSSGFIYIDRTSFNQQVLKARFKFTFQNNTDPDKPLWWEGLIKTPITNDL